MKKSIILFGLIVLLSSCGLKVSDLDVSIDAGEL
jgi:hypothetical protein